jgi:hypothetical protein
MTLNADAVVSVVLTFICPTVYPDTLQSAIHLDSTSSMWVQFIFLDEAC